jgi:hypothetical protein
VRRRAAGDRDVDLDEEVGHRNFLPQLANDF